MSNWYAVLSDTEAAKVDWREQARNTTGDCKPRVNGQVGKSKFVIDILSNEEKTMMITKSVVKSRESTPPPPTTLFDSTAKHRHLSRLAVAIPLGRDVMAYYDRVLGELESAFELGEERRAIAVRWEEGGALLFPSFVVTRAARLHCANQLHLAVMEEIPVAYCGVGVVVEKVFDDGRVFEVAAGAPLADVRPTDLFMALDEEQRAACYFGDGSPYLLRLLDRNPLAEAIDAGSGVGYTGEADEGVRILRGSSTEAVFQRLGDGAELGAWLYYDRDARENSRAVMEFDEHGRYVRTTGTGARPLDRGGRGEPLATCAVNRAGDDWLQQYSQLHERCRFDGHVRIANSTHRLLNPSEATIANLFDAPPPVRVKECGPYHALVLEMTSKLGEEEDEPPPIDVDEVASAFLEFIGEVYSLEPARDDYLADDAVAYDSSAICTVLVTQIVVTDTQLEVMRAAARALGRKRRDCSLRVTTSYEFNQQTAAHAIGKAHRRCRLLSRTSLGDQMEACYYRRWNLSALQRSAAIGTVGLEMLARFNPQRFGPRGFSEGMITVWHSHPKSKVLIAHHLQSLAGECIGVSRHQWAEEEADVLLPPRRLPRVQRSYFEQSIGALGFVMPHDHGYEPLYVGDFDSELRATLGILPNFIAHFQPPVVSDRFPQLPVTFGGARNIIILRGACGAGKSTALNDVCRRLPDDCKAVYISARSALVYQEYLKMSSQANAPQCWFYKNGEAPEQTKIYYTTIHSLHKLIGPNRLLSDVGVVDPFLYVIFDEYCTALLIDFQSTKVIDPPSVERALGKFLHLAARAVYLMDAFDSPSLIVNVLRRIANYPNPTARINIIHTYHATYNLVREQKREVTYLIGHQSRVAMLSKVAWDVIDEGLRIAIFFSSREELETWEEALLQLLDGGLEERQVLKYTALVEGGDAASLPDIILSRDVRLFMFTTALGTGADITFSDDVLGVLEYFHALALVGVATSSYLRLLDVMQASGRIRTTQRLIVDLPEPPMTPFELLRLPNFRRYMEEGTKEMFAADLQLNNAPLAALHNTYGAAALPHEAAMREMADMLGVQLPQTENAYAETLILGHMQTLVTPFRTSAIVAYLAALGYRSRYVYGMDGDDDDTFNEVKLARANAIVANFARKEEEGVSDGMRRKTQYTKRDIGCGPLDDINSMMVEEFVEKNAKMLSRAVILLDMYCALARRRPVTAADWKEAMTEVVELAQPFLHLVRQVEEWGMNSGRMLNADSVIASSAASRRSQMALDVVGLYAATRLLGIDSILSGDEPWEASGRRAAADDFSCIDLRVFSNGRPALDDQGLPKMMKADEFELFCDRQTSEGPLWKVAHRSILRSRVPITRHLQRLLSFLFDHTFSTERGGKLTPKPSDRICLLFGLYARRAGVQGVEVGKWYDGLATVRRHFAARPQPTDAAPCEPDNITKARELIRRAAEENQIN